MIEVHDLTKYYGPKVALQDVSFEAARGDILGLLGPNGAGKSTTMRILTGFFPPTSGTARIAGFDVVERSLEVRRRIGYLPENVPLYTDMTVVAYLDFVARAKDVSQRRASIEWAMDAARVDHVAGSVIGRLSKGYRQRVGLAQALLGDPEVLILDEPTVGLDPNQIIETRQLIKALGGDRTIILSTHILPEVSMVCNKVVIINRGTRGGGGHAGGADPAPGGGRARGPRRAGPGRGSGDPPAGAARGGLRLSLAHLQRGAALRAGRRAGGGHPGGRRRRGGAGGMGAAGAAQPEPQPGGHLPPADHHRRRGHGVTGATTALRRGWNATWAVTRKELYSYLVSPMAYVVAAVFLLVNGFIFYLIIASPQAEASLRPLLPTTAFLLLLLIPVLTMRLLAEEKSTGTIELLMTFPITDTQVVLGKFLATFLVYLLMLLPTLVYVGVIRVFGGNEWGPLVSAYLGLVLLGGAFIAVGMFTSSLTRNQIVAGVLGIGILLLLWVLGAGSTVLGPRLSAVIAYLSLNDHFQNFGQGVIDLKDVIFYLTFTAGALFLTIRIQESSRWRT